MNYLKEIIAFEEMIGYKPLTTGQIALWHALMFTCNKLAWQEWFTVSSHVLETKSGLSRNGVLLARNQLKQLGLIDFRPRGRKATSYKVISLLQDNVHIAVQNNVQNAVQNTVQNAVTLNKQKQKVTPLISPQGGRRKKNSAATDYQQRSYTDEELESVFVNLDEEEGG